MRLANGLVVVAVLCSGCSDDDEGGLTGGSSGSDNQGSQAEVRFEGTRWFPCELVQEGAEAFEPSDDCTLLDDDGLFFAEDGTLSAIELVEGTETGCDFGNVGRCLRSDADETFEQEIVGNWRRQGTTLSVTIDSCSGELLTQGTASAFRLFRLDSDCDVPVFDGEFRRRATSKGTPVRQHTGGATLVAAD